MVAVLCAAACRSTPQQASPLSPTPVRLTCEYLSDPLGVEAHRPRLAWRWPDETAGPHAHQTAYQVMVAASQESLERGEADRWDSGRVESAESSQVVYRGVDLRAGDACWWRVRTWDALGRPSDWSQPARWSMGPLSMADWRGKWIGPPASHRIAGAAAAQAKVWDPWLRKEFDLPTKPTRAELHVASIGYHELHVNGVRVGDAVLAPPVANHRVRARSVTYDIAPLLRAGQNVVALWLGTSWSLYPIYKTDSSPGVPVAIAQCDIHANGRITQLQTDGSWRTHPGPSRLLGEWMFRKFGGEHYDARRELTDWDDVNLDDSAWDAAEVYRPGVVVSASVCEPNIVTDRFTAAAVSQVAPDAWRVDLGKNFTGLLEVDLSAQPGTVVTLLSSDRPEAEQAYSIGSEYVVGPTGAGTFRSRFNYHTGRYLTIRGAARGPDATEVRCLPVRTGYARAGHFECSNELINRVYETTLWTFENLSLGGYAVDCSHRERMGYGGDAHATLGASLCGYSMGAFYNKWAQDWRDCQAGDGYVPNTAPTYWGGGGPAWGGYCITMPWEVYLRYGDRRILEQQRDCIQRWLAFVDSTSSNDLLTPWKGRGATPQDQWMFLGDWLWPGAKGTNSHTEKTLFLNNCYWAYNLATAAKIMRVLGDQPSADAYLRRAAEVRKATHARFYQPQQHSYVNGQQAYLAAALLSETPPPDERPHVWQRLEEEILVHRGGRIDAGITGGALLFKLLIDSGRSDLIYPMVNRTDFPSWGHMLKQGATTIWEAWEERPDSGGSKMHSSYLYVGEWPLTGLVGLRPGPDGGFARFSVAPAEQLFTELQWANASYESDRGPIEFKARATNEGHVLQITAPSNANGALSLPEGRAFESTPDGLTVDANGVVNIPPGRWTFTVVREGS